MIEMVSLDGLSRSERSALRRLLVTAVQEGVSSERLETPIRAAPLDALPAAAALHRVSGIVERNLGCVDGVPAHVRSQLVAMERDASFRHMIAVGALSVINEAFDRAGIDWVAMKGPVATTLLYPGTGDRHYGDLDVLVARHDFGNAVGILEELGYRHSIHNWARAEEMLAGEIGLFSPTVSVDIHWHLHYSRQDRRPFAIDPEAMLERARRVDVSGIDVPTLDPVDTLLVFAFHAARSDGPRLLWFKDIERSMAVEAPDLDELVGRSQLYRCAPPVGLMLARARNLAGARVPQDVVDAMAPRSLQVIERAAATAVSPIQMHERATVTRVITRSVRSSLGDSLADLPARASRWMRARLDPPPVNETDDPLEKERYFRAVATSVG
jgi:hypothetical protein